ncbi:hypothetical protein BB560_001028 [Smittium megazygosporum]|uniref:Peptidase A2 domain-containing protein n=1 Tax=Smittium megazygosporum TaxID=133381 RepID=A0A2T9ZIM7_9FUNG|nr:hypothetical protein BB560_001028 [Smittium megazygosporum]
MKTYTYDFFSSEILLSNQEFQTKESYSHCVWLLEKECTFVIPTLSHETHTTPGPIDNPINLNPLLLELKINEKPYFAIVDSGATTETISNKLVTETDLQKTTLTSPVNLTVADGNSYQITEKCMFTALMQDKIVKIYALVFNNSKHPLIKLFKDAKKGAEISAILIQTHNPEPQNISLEENFINMLNRVDSPQIRDVLKEFKTEFTIKDTPLSPPPSRSCKNKNK